MRSALPVAMLIASVAFAGSLRAQPRSIDDATVTRRLATVTHLLQAEEPSAWRWRRDWLITFAALTVVQTGGSFLAPDPGLRIDSRVGAVKSSLALAAMLVKPFAPASAATKLSELPEGTAVERREKLRVAEELLKESSTQEEFGQSWIPRVVSSVANLAGTYYLWLQHQRYAAGWFALFAGMGVAELQIRTQPTGAIDAWHAYSANPDAAPRAASSAPRWTLGVAVAPSPSLLLGATF